MRRALPVAMLGVLLAGAAIAESDEPRRTPERVDAQMLVDLDLLSDDRFDERTYDDLELPEWRDEDHGDDEPTE